MQFHFADFVLNTGRRELRRNSELIAVEPQVYDLLLYLVQHRDRVVTKDDLIASVWGRPRHVRCEPDKPYLCRAQGGRRQRPAAETDPHYPAQGVALCR